MPTYTPVIDNGGQVYNVRAFGAAGDGTANDAPEINSALGTARKTGDYGTPGGQGQPVLVPSGVYVLENTVPPEGSAPGALNLTGSEFNLRGAGSHQTVLRAGTGGVAVDMTGAELSTVRDVLIDDLGRAAPSTIGILQARAASGAAVHSNHLYNLTVRLRRSATANGAHGTVGIYNLGCGTTTYESIHLRADIGLFLGSVNNLDEDPQAQPGAFAASSPYLGALAASAGLANVSVRGTSSIFSLRGPAVRIREGAYIDLGDAALASVWYEEQGMTGPYPYAIEVVGPTTGLRYSGSMENYPRLLKVRSTLQGLFLNCYAAHDRCETRIVLADGALLEGGSIDVVPTAGGTMGGLLLEAERGTAGVVVRGMHINLYQQGINLGQHGVLSGCFIRSSRSLFDTRAGIVAGTKQGNVIVATDGVHIDGLTPWC